MRITGDLCILGAMLAADYLHRQKETVPVYVARSLPNGWHAMTIPPIGIFVREDCIGNSSLLEHELVHWEQYRRLGLPLFYAAYLAGMVDGYDAHPMELDARFRESDFVKQNYTWAVRNGIAKTVYDPGFRL